MKENNKTYGAADFARYYGGHMTPDEMHRLEKAALEDPFLEDALDGYTNTTAYETDIKELHQRLNEKQKKKAFSLYSVTKNTWWRIAAMFIIFAGGGYIIFRLDDNTKSNYLSKTEITKAAISDSAVMDKAGSAPVNSDSNRDQLSMNSPS